MLCLCGFELYSRWVPLFITGALRAKRGERGILRETNTKRGKRGGENKALYYSSPPVPRLALILRFA